MSSAAPCVSILVPVYNVVDVVDETLRSAIAQGSACEVLAVDDGSTDGSAVVVSAHAPGVSLVRQINQGASATRNALLRRARGEWVVFLDADDVLLPQAVERAMAVADRTGADVICADWMPLREGSDGIWHDGEVVSVRPPDDGDPALDVFRGWWLPPGAILVRKVWAERVGGFRLDLPVIQDARFLFDLARAGARFAVTSEPALRYRERAGVSLSRRDPSAFWRDCLLNTEQVEAGYAAQGRSDCAVREALLGGFELAARSLGAVDSDAARRALRGARRQLVGGLNASRWLRLALVAQPLLGGLLACRLSGLFAREARA